MCISGGGVTINLMSKDDLLWFEPERGMLASEFWTHLFLLSLLEMFFPLKYQFLPSEDKTLFFLGHVEGFRFQACGHKMTVLSRGQIS
jgi:hypothetical protein